MDPGWARVLASVESTIHSIGDFLRGEIDEGRGYLPDADLVLRVFTQPFEDVRVLIVGQDPYPTPGHAVGLSFAVDPSVRPIPRSLANIFAEYAEDLGYSAPANGDLSSWSRNGVMLLNRVLTVTPGAPGSHRRQGWEEVTRQAVEALVARDLPLVAVLWGRDAQTLVPLLGDTPVIASPHPSPLSARRGFFGSRPFSRTNAELLRLGAEPINWELDGDWVLSLD